MTNVQRPFGRAITGLLLFGIAFGYVEAAVVVYLRGLLEPVRRQVSSAPADGELFPLLTVDQLQAVEASLDCANPSGPGRIVAPTRYLWTELGREGATLVMLAGVALLAARNRREWLAVFVIAFGVWDIFYYVFLKLLLGWPASLMTWDILFLLPVPWVGPVLTPTLVALVMILGGTLVLRREYAGRPTAFRPAHWAAIIGGGLIIVVSFCWDWRNIAAGGYPNPFNWPLYGAGLLASVAGFTHGLRGTTPTRPPTRSPDA
jgi:hypothetical protein